MKLSLEQKQTRANQKVIVKELFTDQDPEVVKSFIQEHISTREFLIVSALWGIGREKVSAKSFAEEIAQQGYPEPVGKISRARINQIAIKAIGKLAHPRISSQFVPTKNIGEDK